MSFGSDKIIQQALKKEKIPELEDKYLENLLPRHP